ncbi:MAG: hypothetical protein ACKN9V_00555 [Pseudomonadota bacterium]
MRLRPVYFLYIALVCFRPLKPFVFAAEYHGARMEEGYQRPKASHFSPEAVQADRILLKFITGSNPDDIEGNTKHLAHLKKFPEVIKHRASEIVAFLESLERGQLMTEAFCIELLAILENPDLIPIFETYLKHSDRIGEVRFPAAAGLAAIYKKYPELITEARKEFLFEILNAKDQNDLARLYLRQLLPTDLARELDEQVYVWQKAKRPYNALNLAQKRIKKDALSVATAKGGPPARRALAFQSLLELETPTQNTVREINKFLQEVVSAANEKPERIHLDESLLNTDQIDKLEQFVNRVQSNSRGLGLNIHDGIQLENLFITARRKGLELDAQAVKSAKELIQNQFNLLWNSGSSLVRYQGDSSLSNYAQAAMILSSHNSPLSPALSDALTHFQKLRRQINPDSGLPQLHNYTSEAYRKDATAASSAGRALTSQLVFYRHSNSATKASEAQELLKTASNFESHFSQLFELANFFRTHDRNPRGEGMAPYYGFGNVTYAADALVLLSNDPSLSKEQHQKVRWLSDRITNRLLNLMRFEDRFTDINEYNFLSTIALNKLDSAFGSSKRQ